MRLQEFSMHSNHVPQVDLVQSPTHSIGFEQNEESGTSTFNTKSSGQGPNGPLLERSNTLNQELIIPKTKVLLRISGQWNQFLLNQQVAVDVTKPDGTPRKVMDVSKLKSMDWSASVNLKEGLEHSYSWFLDNQEQLRAR